MATTDRIGRGLFCVISMATLIAAPGIASGAMTGDKALLSAVSAKYKENLESLKKWSGSVKLTMDTVTQGDADKSYHSEYSIDFLYDSATARFRSRATTEKNEYADGRQLSQVPLVVYSFMRRGDDWYELTFTGKEVVRVARLYEPPDSYPSWGYHRFMPKVYFTEEGEEHTAYLDSLVREFDSETRSGSVRMEGDDVIIEEVSSDSAWQWTRVFSLNAGGNMTRFSMKVKSDGNEYVNCTTWEWKDVDGVFVPARISRQQTEKAKDQSEVVNKWAYEWETKSLSDAIPEGEFALKHLGLREGDGIKEKDKPTRLLKRGDLE